jgi:hypothetical protein
MPFRSVPALFHCCCLLLNPDCYFFSRRIQSAAKCFDQQAACMEHPAWPAWLAADRQRARRRSPTRYRRGNSHPPIASELAADRQRAHRQSPARSRRGNSHLPVAYEVGTDRQRARRRSPTRSRRGNSYLSIAYEISTDRQRGRQRGLAKAIVICRSSVARMVRSKLTRAYAQVIIVILHPAICGGIQAKATQE